MTMFTIPNLLTFLRILCIPVFVACFYLEFPWHRSISAAVFALAALTDLLDGYFSRILNQHSLLGEFLDPVADKLIVSTALILLVHHHPSIILTFPVVIIIGREITVSALREWMAKFQERNQVAVSYVGKIKAALQMISIILLVYEKPLYLGISAFNVGMVLLYVAMLLTLWSMYFYLLKTWPRLKS